MSPKWRSTSAGRSSIVSCHVCGASEINESNRLKRGGWQETLGVRPRRYRCGACAADHEEMLAMIQSEASSPID